MISMLSFFCKVLCFLQHESFLEESRQVHWEAALTFEALSYPMVQLVSYIKDQFNCRKDLSVCVYGRLF